MVHTASRNSLIRRVTLANACHRGLEGMRKFFPVPAGLQRSGRKEHAINKNDYSQARRDKHMMGSTGRLEEFRIGRQRKQPAVVQKAVKFILHPENIEMLAWGVRVVEVDGIYIEIPMLVRRTSLRKLHKRYLAAHGGHDEVHLRRQAFIDLAGVLTSGRTKQITALDGISEHYGRYVTTRAWPQQHAHPSCHGRCLLLAATT